MFVLTDGLSSDQKDTRLRAKDFHGDGVHVVSVGVGAYVNHKELLDIASENKYVFTLHNTDALHDILENAMTGCKGMHYYSHLLSDTLYMYFVSVSGCRSHIAM